MQCVNGFGGDMVLTEVEGRISDQYSDLLDKGLSMADAVAEIEGSTLETNDPEVADALADPVFRAWLLGEQHPAVERDRLAALLKCVENFAADLPAYHADQLRKVLRGE